MMTAPGLVQPAAAVASLEGAKRRNPPPDSLQAVGWKLGLAYCQFLPSPEAPVVLDLIMVVDVVVEMDDIEAALIEMARDNISKGRITRHLKYQKRILSARWAKCRIHNISGIRVGRRFL